MSKGHKWAFQCAAVPPLAPTYMDTQFRGNWRADWQHAAKKVTSKVKKSDRQALDFTATREIGTPAAYSWFEEEGPQWKAPKELMDAQKQRENAGKRGKMRENGRRKRKCKAQSHPEWKRPHKRKRRRTRNNARITSEGQPLYERPAEGTPEEEEEDEEEEDEESP